MGRKKHSQVGQMERWDGVSAFSTMARPEERNCGYIKQNGAQNNGGKYMNGFTHNQDEVSTCKRKRKKSVNQIDTINTIVHFLLKITVCIFLWIILAVCFIIPLGIPIIVYYALKLIEQFIYKRFYDAEPLTGIDSLWMHGGSKNRIIINALSIVEGQLDASEMQEVLQRKLINAKDDLNGNRLYLRTTKYVHRGFLSYYWIEEENFKLEDHVLSADEVKSKDELRQMLSDLCSRPLKPGCSPWEYIVIPWRCQNNVSKVALFFRGHHCMADGISLGRFLAYELPDKQPQHIELRKFSERDRFLLTLKGIFWGPIFLAKMLTTRCDESALHSKELSGKKRVTWSDPVDLNVVKRIKNATRTTVNDVLVSCLTGALVRYFRKKGLKQPDDIPIALPVDLRKNMDRDAMDFANKLAILELKLPSGVEEPLSMLYETKRRVDELKMSGEPFSVNIAMTLFSAALPEIITRRVCKYICEKTSAVLSNVPGPQSLISIADCEMDCLTFWPPQRDNIGMSISICSYASKVFVGVLADEAILQDPHEICCEFPGQIARLQDCCDLQKID